MPSSKNPKLLPLRAAVILLAAVLVGAGAGALTYLGTRTLATSILAGGSAFAAAVIWLDTIISS
jgi:hypothetical protein